MARMIPSRISPDTTSAAERLLYKKFEKLLPNDFTVFSGLRWIRRARPIDRSDADFIVFHREVGFLFIEAKSGHVWHQSDGLWLRRKPGSVQPERITNPWGQAENSMLAILDFLQEEGVLRSRNELRHYHAIALPHMDKQVGKLTPDGRRESVLLHGDISSLREWVEAAVNVTSPRPISKELFDRIVDRLSPELGFAQSLSARAEIDEPELVRLTETQHHILLNGIFGRSGSSGRMRALIQGEAGSGKTLMALELARRLVRSDPEARVLFLTFHLPVADFVRRELQGTERIDVFGFHAFAEHVVRETNGSWPDPQRLTPRERGQFYKVESPNLLEGALQRYPVRYTAVVADEGQDFNQYWWMVIEEALEDPVAGGLYIFFDDKQDVHEHEYAFPIADPPFYLGANLRSTQAICRFNDELVGLERDPADLESAPEGVRPEPIVANTEDDEWDAVRRLLHRYVHEEGVREDQIVVIGGHPWGKTPYSRKPQMGNLTLINSEEPQGRGKVRYATPGRFKGLEADVVIVVGFDDLEITQPKLRARLYVACSRAKHSLDVVVRRPRTVLVQDIAPGVPEDEIREAFEKFGGIEDMRVGPSTKRPGTNHAYVRMTAGNNAQRAAGVLHGLRLGGQPIIATLLASRRIRPLVRPATFYRKIYIGGLGPDVTHDMLRAEFEKVGPALNVFIPEDQLDADNRFAFVSYEEPEDSARAIARYDRQEWRGRRLRVFRAYDNVSRDERRPELHRVFVGGLDWHATREEFVSRFPSCATMDGMDIPTHDDGRSKGVGFLRFQNREHAERAIREIDGAEFRDRTLRADWAVAPSHAQQRSLEKKGRPASFGVFVGNLPGETDAAQLTERFAPFGDHTVLVRDGHAFVNFERRPDAEKAIEMMDGKEIEGRRLTVKRSNRPWPGA